MKRRLSIIETSALPLSTPILHRWKTASFTKWREDTRPLSDWLEWATKQADRADHEPENTPHGLLRYLVEDLHDYEFFTA